MDTQRLLIAEFALLDVNVETMVNYLEERQHFDHDENNRLVFDIMILKIVLTPTTVTFASLQLLLTDSLDEDELAVLESQVSFLLPRSFESD